MLQLCKADSDEFALPGSFWMRFFRTLIQLKKDWKYENDLTDNVKSFFTKSDIDNINIGHNLFEINYNGMYILIPDSHIWNKCPFIHPKYHIDKPSLKRGFI